MGGLWCGGEDKSQVACSLGQRNEFVACANRDDDIIDVLDSARFQHAFDTPQNAATNGRYHQNAGGSVCSVSTHGVPGGGAEHQRLETGAGAETKQAKKK